MKVIGAGLPRTATTSQAIAYEKLGFPCYHMRDVFMDMDNGLTQWEAVADGKPDWEAIFDGAQSTCDWPGARYYKELLEYYPDSKVVLSVRSAGGWVRSMRDTIWAIYFGDSVMHHLIMDDGSADLGDVVPGANSRGFTLRNANAANFHCTLHSTMVGSINGATAPETPQCNDPYGYGC
jgi:hypothetical protein